MYNSDGPTDTTVAGLTLRELESALRKLKNKRAPVSIK